MPQNAIKRTFDVLVATVVLVLASWVILLAWLSVVLESGRPGFFRQARVGMCAETFRVIKLRTMRLGTGGITATARNDPRITRVGRALRKYKLDELPQFWNVLKGDMSLVGPRPDVPGFADELVGNDRLLLAVRPGLTGPATLKYRDEEELLARAADPETVNRREIWPDKVRINVAYVQNYSFRGDLRYLWQTITSA